LAKDSHGQSKEASCGAQEELETPQGNCQTFAQEGNQARDEKGEVQVYELDCGETKSSADDQDYL
jgi:hypothetical protein